MGKKREVVIKTIFKGYKDEIDTRSLTAFIEDMTYELGRQPEGTVPRIKFEYVGLDNWGAGGRHTVSLVRDETDEEQQTRKAIEAEQEDARLLKKGNA